jgi:hypothetical protein
LTKKSLRLGCQMSRAIPAAVLGRSVTLFASCAKLAAPCLTSAPKPSRQAPVPMVKMLAMRRDCCGLHDLGGFPCPRAKLDHLRTLRLRSTLQRFVEDRRHMKLDHFPHSHLLMFAKLCGLAAKQPGPSHRPLQRTGLRDISLSKTAPQTR